jgi:hypothetical protein
LPKTQSYIPSKCLEYSLMEREIEKQRERERERDRERERERDFVIG